jgi:SAM-dependent methyltransferase
MAGKQSRSTGFPVDLLTHSGEALPFGDRCADTVVTTFTLCTIPDPVKALREMRRVLKPGGLLLYAEHGLAPDPSVERWQRRLNPVWRTISGGCNLDRKIDELIAEAGFCGIELESEYAKGPRPMSYIYAGRATPPQARDAAGGR